MENTNLKERFIDDKNGIEYIKNGDYYVPNLSRPKAHRIGNIGKYGLMRLNYIKECKKTLYNDLLLNNELSSHLLDIEDECKTRLETLINQLKEQENITEELKAINQLKWVGKMNNIKNRAEEIILSDLIYI